ncbi:anthrone oxygenase family protein [Curtobacterium sp. NPDC098951]|uniref:anthrone oxygenase family protein n=1 Tax=Curtobacterium sp. NPDC098951 TaxID=3363974 RepID=UPI00381972A0
MNVIVVVQLVLVGLLAGEEFVVRWGVQPAVATLPDDAHLRTRIALVKSLKVVVPILMVPAVLATVAVLVVAGAGDGLGWRVAAAVALGVFVLASFLGTVPINIGVNDWDPLDPPADWKRVVVRWERIDVLRSSAAIAAFVLTAIGLVQMVA